MPIVAFGEALTIQKLALLNWQLINKNFTTSRPANPLPSFIKSDDFLFQPPRNRLVGQIDGAGPFTPAGAAICRSICGASGQSHHRCHC